MRWMRTRYPSIDGRAVVHCCFTQPRACCGVSCTCCDGMMRAPYAADRTPNEATTLGATPLIGERGSSSYWTVAGLELRL